MIQGFKEFISRGNAIDLAVGMIIGAAFTGVVTALVEKVINPLIGGIFGKPDFDSLLQFTLGQVDASGNPIYVQPGAILTALVNFLLVAIALYFFLIVPMNKLNERRKAKEETEAEAPAEPSAEEKLLTEIRDLLATQRQ